MFNASRGFTFKLTQRGGSSNDAGFGPITAAPQHFLAFIVGMTIFRFCSLVLLSTMALNTQAAGRDVTDPYSKYRYDEEFDYDDSGDVPWREIVAEIPPLPGAEEFNLLQIDTLPQEMRAYLHVPTLSVSERDDVVRYWLLLAGQAGGFNATYEGVRCNTGEYKVYAYGNPKRQPQVRVVPNPEWQTRKAARHNYRDELTRDYLCAGRSPRTLTQIRTEVNSLSDYDDPLKQYHH